MSELSIKWLGTGLIIGMGIGVVGALTGLEGQFHQQAIKHGTAEYNQTTGEFQWKKNTK